MGVKSETVKKVLIECLLKKSSNQYMYLLAYEMGVERENQIINFQIINKNNPTIKNIDIA